MKELKLIKKVAKVPTLLARKIKAAGKKIQYNNHILNILKDKTVLAYILSFVVSEFKGYTAESIIETIGEPKVHKVPVEPGMKRKRSETIRGESTDSIIPGEGMIFFDILFTTYAGTKNPVKLYINIEAQRKFSPGYDIVTRAIVYGARMISEQIEAEAVTSNYDNVKKVYSIWLCLNAPKSVQDSIIEYSIKPEALHGNYSKASRYDIMSVIIVCLNNNTLDSKNKLIGMLSNLLSPRLDFEEKKKTLESSYGFKMSKEVEAEANTMCNLADEIEDEVIKNIIKNMISDGLPDEKIMLYANCDEDLIKSVRETK